MAIKKRTSFQVKSTGRKPKSKTAKVTVIKERMTKSQILAHLAEATELTKKQIRLVLETLIDLGKAHLKKGGAGEFVIPGLAKCMVKRKPATKARKGINPFTGEAMTFKAKPARNVVKIRPLKQLKEIVE
ncbi:HU family DNA-binding protein [Coxiella endosymbiont of Amblyomma nuttalli]|uniref:HU family DNA-binding protein n=1 Tax=Coxiella endosymbiont of Amblyomma nuttalli TaxID=2749996 RepID=UPI001BAB13D4|nr:HU family DNA-binding protein [Coxiella endosymbiont of Amblyomma nuttalli]QTS83982.1 DNA-binding protein HRL53 [Coxiella endosymbiont of Amblyomma nuttalli]